MFQQIIVLFMNKYISEDEVESQLTNIKINNKILHQSKLIKLF